MLASLRVTFWSREITVRILDRSSTINVLPLEALHLP
jgi:hypothetical protein